VCVEQYPNLKLAERDAQDDKNNTTRFFVIGKTFGSPSGKNHTLLTFGVKHVIGSLSTALSCFASRGINLCGIESYVDKHQQWAYNFLVELEGHEADEPVAAALRALKEHSEFINIIGSFPKDLTEEYTVPSAQGKSNL